MTESELREILGRAFELIRRLAGELHDLQTMSDDPGSFGVQLEYPPAVERAWQERAALAATFQALDATIIKQVRDLYREEKGRADGDPMPDLKMPDLPIGEFQTAVDDFAEEIRRACRRDPALDGVIRPGASRG